MSLSAAIQITGISINPAEPLSRSFEITFRVDETSMGSVRLSKNGQLASNHPLLTPFELHTGSILTIQVKEIHQVRKDKIFHHPPLSPERIYQEQEPGTPDDQPKKYRIRLKDLKKDIWLNFLELAPTRTTTQLIPHVQDQAQNPLKVAINKALEELSDFSTIIEKIGRGKHLLDAGMKFGLAVSELVPKAKAIVGCIAVIYERIKDQDKGHEEIVTLAKSMEKAIDHVRTVEKIVKLNHVQETLKTFPGLMQDTVNLIKAYVEQSLFVNFFFTSSNNDKITELKGRHSTFIEECDRGVKVDEAVKVDYLADKGEMKDLEKYLSKGVTTVDPTATECIKGTRKEILANITSKTDNLDGANIIWVHGAPGSGKSSTSLSTKSRLKQQGQLVTYFRFDRNQASTTTTIALWQHVALYLARKLPSVYKHVLKHAQDDKINLDSPTDIFEHLIEEPLSKLTEHALERPLVIIIDGLDECGGLLGRSSPDRQALLQTLQQWSKLPPHVPVKLLVTSREEGDIQELLSTLSKNASIHIPSGSALADDPTSQSSINASNDIRIFLEFRLVQIAKWFKLDPNWPGNKRIDDMVQRAAGNFMWVTTATSFVDSSLDPDEGLELIMGPTSNPDGMKPLYSLYSTILETSFRTISDSDAETVRIILGSMIYAKRPLSEEEYTKLPTLKTIRPVTLQSIRSGLRSVIVPGSDLRFVHKSFDDFLLSVYCPQKFAIDEANIHYLLTRLCISTMSSESGLHFNICNLDTSCLRNADVPEIDSKVELGISKTLSYSCCFWADHLSCTRFNNELMLKVGEVLRNKLLYWFEAMSLLKEMNRVSRALLWVLNWLKSSSNEYLKDFIRDARQFIGAFIHPIAQSAPHIYISALPFAPENSLVAKHFLPQFPWVFSLSVGKQTNWSPCLFTSEHHKDRVTSVAFSPDEKSFISGSFDTTVCLCDSETGSLISDPFQASPRVSGAFFSPDGQRIWANCDDGRIFGWDVEKGNKHLVFTPNSGHEKSSCCCFNSGGDIVSMSHIQGTITVWSAETGKQLQKLSNITADNPIRVMLLVAFSPKGDYMAWVRHGVSGTAVRIQKLVDGSEIKGQDVEGHSNWFSAISFAVDGLYVVTGSTNGTIVVWDVKAAKIVDRPLATGKGRIDAVAYSHDNKLVASATGNPGTVTVWNASTRELVLGPLEGHTSPISTITLSRDGRRALSGSYDRTVRMWDLGRRGVIHNSRATDGPTGGVSCIEFTPCGKRLVSVGSDSILRVWDATTGIELPRLKMCVEADAWAPVKIIVSPDGGQIVAYSQTNLSIWNIDTGELVFSTKHSPKPLRGYGTAHLAFRSTDHRLITCSEYGDGLRAWCIENSVVTEDTSISSPTQKKDPDKPARILALSSDGLTAFVGDFHRTLCHNLWSTTTSQPLLAIPNNNHIEKAAFSPSGRVLATMEYLMLQIWDTQTGELTNSRAIRSHSCLIVSSDNRHIAYSNSSSISIWNTCTSHPMATPWNAHSGEIKTLAFSPDGKKLASGSEDGQIRIWDTSDLVEGLEPSVGFLGVGVSMRDGWVMGSDGRLLFWVPNDHRRRLVWPRNIMVIGGHGVPTELDLSNFRYGDDWMDCFEVLVGEM